ncbi:Cpg1 family polymorphic protein, partial [Anaplasma phagocytophilum]|uniref:Cpg1 family polymorphic protein n=1 Tax=Anaplasma phagocytophilum TaxID=948 RepID=UPI000A9387C0
GNLTALFGDHSCSERNESLAQILGDTSERLSATNMSAMPASISVITTMYLALPIIAFGGYAAQWVSRRMSSRGRGNFTPPEMFSMLSAAVCVKLGLNTFLTLTAHVSHRAFSTALNWSVTRLYLPLSLIEQPKKIGLFVNSAMSAAWSSRRLRFEPSSRACAIAAAASLPFEYAGHVVAKLHVINTAWTQVPPACRQILNFTVKHARVAAFFGAIIAARKHIRNMPYSRRLERIIWADGVKATTAPAALLLLDIAAGNVFLSTVVLTIDSLVSLIPDMICSANVDMLNNAGNSLAALEQWLVENLDEEALLKMAMLTSLQRLPGSTHGELEKILEEFYNKDQIIDHGVDLIVDDDFTEGVTERQLLEWQSNDASRRRTRGGDCADASSESGLIGATSSNYYDPPERRGVTLYEELVRGILERHGARGVDAASEGDSVEDELLSHQRLSQKLDDAAVLHEDSCDGEMSLRLGRLRFDSSDDDVESQRHGDARRSRRGDRRRRDEGRDSGDRGHSSRGAASESDARRSRRSDRGEPATSPRRHPAREVPQQSEASPSGPRNHPSGAIPKVRSSTAATHTKKDGRKKNKKPSAAECSRGAFDFLGSPEDLDRYVSDGGRARASSPRRAVGAPHRSLDRVVYETEGAQDVDDGVFDISRYMTPRNQAGDSGLRSGRPAASSSGAPRGAPGLAPGTSLTSLDEDALDILSAIQGQQRRRR